MSDSMGQSYKASDFGAKKTKTKKPKQGSPDTPEAREARIQLYMSRANTNPSAKEPTPRRGPNGRPINIFTGKEYTKEEMEVLEVEDDTE